MTWDLRRRVLAGFGLCLILIAAGEYAAYLSLRNLIEINHWVVHTNQVLNSLTRCLSLLSDAETGERGYVLTGKEEYLAPYQTAQQALPGEFIKLRELTSDNPSQQERIAKIDPLMTNMLAEFARTIELRRNSGLEAARKLVELDASKRKMDEIRGLVAEMEQREYALLSARDEAAERQARWSIGFALLSGLLAILGIIAGSSLLNREMTARQEAQQELRTKLDELLYVHAELDRTSKLQLETKDQILSQVSHELRTPLNAAYQFVTILQDGLAGETNAEQKEYLAIIFRNLKQLQAMIEDVLDSTRAASGKLSLEPQPIDLNQIIVDLVRTLISPAAERHITVVHTPVSALPMVYADPVRLRQIVTNLLDNAVKFSPENGSVIIDARLWEQNPFFVCISIKDHGCGIPTERLRKIFDRLYQVNNKSDSARKGLGLGLYICRELVIRMGGQIWVESVAGEGSTFFFTIPVATVESAEHVQ